MEDYEYMIVDTNNPSIVQYPALSMTQFERVTMDTFYNQSQQKKSYFLLSSKFPQLTSMSRPVVKIWYQSLLNSLAHVLCQGCGTGIPDEPACR